MFGNFLSPSFANQRKITQENNIMAKKPGEQSAKAVRRPFGERSANVTDTPVVTKPKIDPVTPKVDSVPFESIDVENNPCFYICSYQDPKDFDDDISGEFFGKADRLAFVRSFLEDMDERLKVNYRCEADEVPAYEVEDGFDLFKPDLFGLDFKLDEVKVPLPSFNF